MKVVIALFALVALAVAAPANPDADAYIVRQVSENIGVDGYNYAIETSNGISQQEEGRLINSGTENEAISAKGSFKYTGPDGVEYEVKYVADDTGFHPGGVHLPKRSTKCIFGC